jgi:hypothetical protein
MVSLTISFAYFAKTPPRLWLKMCTTTTLIQVLKTSLHVSVLLVSNDAHMIAADVVAVLRWH